jgi:hypothetical protein
MSYEAIDDTGRIVKLKKRFQCEWCGEWLIVGERAVTRSYKFDGGFNSARMHPECFEAMKKSLPAVSDDGFETGNQSRGCLIGVLTNENE